MPTILNLLGLQANVPVLGQDLYGARTPYYAAVSYFDNGIIITKDKVYADGKIEGINNGSCYLIQNNEWIQTKVTDCAEIIPKRDTEIDLSAKLIKYNLFKEIK